jgi:hypothetical protein
MIGAPVLAPTKPVMDVCAPPPDIFSATGEPAARGVHLERRIAVRELDYDRASVR